MKKLISFIMALFGGVLPLKEGVFSWKEIAFFFITLTLIAVIAILV